MKFWFKLILVLFTLVLFLTACKKETTEFRLKEFGCTASFFCGDEEYKGDFSFVDKNEMSFTVNCPEIIKGCRFIYKNGITTLSFDGVTINVRETSPVKIMFDTFSDLSQKTYKVRSEGTDIISADDETGKYEVTVDCDRRIIKEINTGDTIFTFN